MEPLKGLGACKYIRDAYDRLGSREECYGSNESARATSTDRCSKPVFDRVPSVRKKKFNDPRLPKHVDENTVFGRKTKTEFSAIDVIFPVNLFGEKFVEDEKDAELYRISHHAYGTGEQLKRNYTTSFNPDYRYGKRLKWLPPGFWFKNSVKYESGNENKNNITDFISNVLERENEHCRYPYVDNRQGKFLGRSYGTAKDVMTRSDPDEKEFEFIEYLSAVNKIRHTVKKMKYDLKELREAFDCLDKERTGWVPLERAYSICYQRGIRPAKKSFDPALNAINAIKNDHVRYDLFADLLDPNVQYSPRFDGERRRTRGEFNPSYKDDYVDRSTQSARELDKHTPQQKPVAAVPGECFGPETTVKALLNPSIFSNYGLTFWDFYVGRSKDAMEQLFRDAGVNLSRDTFDRVWDNARRRDNGADDKASVEAFRRTLEEELRPRGDGTAIDDSRG